MHVVGGRVQQYTTLTRVTETGNDALEANGISTLAPRVPAGISARFHYQSSSLANACEVRKWEV